jgi:hypothetical protein
MVSEELGIWFFVFEIQPCGIFWAKAVGCLSDDQTVKLITCLDPSPLRMRKCQILSRNS